MAEETCILAIDFQMAEVTPNPFDHKTGFDKVYPPSNQLLQVARETGAFVLHILSHPGDFTSDVTRVPHAQTENGGNIHVTMNGKTTKLSDCEEWSERSELIPDIDRRDTDFFCVKNSRDPFIESRTNVTDWLRANNVTRTLAIGFHANSCVVTTAKRSYYSGFKSYVVTDCTAPFYMDNDMGISRQISRNIILMLENKMPWRDGGIIL